MKLMSIKMFFLVLLIFLLSCQSPQEPEQPTVELQLEIVAPDQVPSDPNDTCYQRILSWTGGFNPTSGDTLAESLRRSHFQVTDLWYPNEVGICLIPMITERAVVKLQVPDTTFYQCDFEPLEIFPAYCSRQWRHYQFIRDNQ